MEIVGILLNVENWQLIIAIIVMIGGLFGQPYLVRELNKKKLDKKADKELLDVAIEDIRKKANITYVDAKIEDVSKKVEENRKEQNDTIVRIDTKLTDIYGILINMKNNA